MATSCQPLQEIIDNRINIRAIVTHSVPIIYAQLDASIDTTQATCNTCRSINNTAAGAIDASLIRKALLSARNPHTRSFFSMRTNNDYDKLHLFHVLCQCAGGRILQRHNQRSSFDAKYIGGGCNSSRET